MLILVINSGSSSLKFQLFKMPDKEVLASGMVERIGIDGGEVHYKTTSAAIALKKTIKDHEVALDEVAQLLLDKENGVINNVADVAVVGHRVVHGGKEFTHTMLINEDVKANIRRLFLLAPLHNPPNLTGIEVAENIFKQAKQVAVFDTAFHQTMPRKAYQYAIANSFLEEWNIRAYGFHGTSHKYVSERAAGYFGAKPKKMVTLHLGNGCSAAAIKDGKCIDTSLGFSPVNGLIMGTRSGDIDQSVIFYLIEKLSYTPEAVNELLNKKSGMLGLTGKSDLRDIEEAAATGDASCKLALAMNAYRIKKYIGAYAAALNGLDVLVFTAGIGENSSTLRQLVCEDMGYLGIDLDNDKNNMRSKEIREIQTSPSTVKILVVPTNEELEIAEQAYSLLA
ncbi:MAG: acetate kinase [Cytophagaceae bacterium]|nr:acetate kinase [Cytophagaceae bacterium]